MKKFLSVVIVLCLIAGMITNPVRIQKVWAVSSGDYEYYEYDVLADETISITKYTGSDAVVAVPSEIAEKRVAQIGESAFCGNSTLMDISLPDGLTNIEYAAFMKCINLKSISLPAGLVSIGNSAFAGCANLKEIQIPDGVVSIGRTAFSDCESLTELNLPDSVTGIGEAAFQFCKGLAKISIPDGINVIARGTFGTCTGLTEISIPDSVTSIEIHAFMNCRNLKDVYYSGTQEQWNNIEIDNTGNENLKSASIHYSESDDQTKDYEYESLGDGTIEITKYKGGDEVLHIPASIDGKRVTGIGEEAFLEQEDLTEIILPDGVVNIGINAFADCTGLTEIILPDSVTYIDDAAFSGCTSLEKIIIPKDITKIESSVFSGCVSLTEINLPDGVTGIGNFAFNGCTGLKKITIPVSVTSVGDFAFTECSSLKDVYYSGTDVQWTEMEISTYGNSELISANKHFSNGSDQTTDDETEEYDYILHSDNTIEITKYKGSDAVVKVPAQISGKRVTEIGKSAFAGNKNIMRAELPAEITKIGDEAFSLCSSMSSIELPASLESIGRAALEECSSLSSINLPSGLNSIGLAAFSRCSSLTGIEIPEGVKLIDGWTFSGCNNLSGMKIPKSVTEIEFGTLGSLYNHKLKDIYYAGTKEEWEKILFDGSLAWNEDFFKITVHYGTASVDNPTAPASPGTEDARQELERLKTGDSFMLEKDFQHYLSDEQTDMIESYLYTWLAEINYAYKYSGSSGIKAGVMKKAGIDPQGDFASGREQAVTHISVETKYGTRTFEITMDLGKADSSGNLYPAYGIMHYEVLEKENIPSDVTKSGQIGRDSYTDMVSFIECVSKTSEESLYGTYQWEALDDEMTSGVLIDKTVIEIIGSENGSFANCTFIVYEKPLFKFSKKITISCPVDVYVYSMDGKGAGSVVDNKLEEKDRNVRLDADGDVKTVYLTGNDYYLNLRGTDTGTMKYEVEEIANDAVCRKVQFLELELKDQLQYEGYVFRPLNIDRDLYALRTVGDSSREVFHADSDSYKPLFRQIEGLSLSEKNTSLTSRKTVQLSASLQPSDASNPNLSWTTDNESVAKVDSSGLVTAVGAGRTTVTVATKDGSFLKQFCMIDVAGSSSGSSGSPGSSGSFGGSSGWPGSSAPSIGQTQKPAVVKLHYIVQFDINGGTKLSRKKMTLLAGDTPGIMPKAQRKDYLFSGWYTQKEGGTQVAGDQPLDGAVTLYARWTKAEPPAQPASLTLRSVKKGQIKADFQKVNSAAGYQIEYSASKNFRSAAAKDASAAAESKTITGLKAGKKYYIRVRAYCSDSAGNRIYGAYSAAKSIKVKA